MTTTTVPVRAGAGGTRKVRRAGWVVGVWMLGAVAGLACARIEAAPARSAAGVTPFSPIPVVASATPGTYDAVKAQRGQVQFLASCAPCHTRPVRGSATRARVPFTRLRDLWQHAPYFTDGSAATLVAVVEHYDGTLNLRLTKTSQGDLVEYLKSR